MNHNHTGHMSFMVGAFALALLLRADLGLVMNIVLGLAVALGLVFRAARRADPLRDDQHSGSEQSHRH